MLIMCMWFSVTELITVLAVWRHPFPLVYVAESVSVELIVTNPVRVGKLQNLSVAVIVDSVRITVTSAESASITAIVAEPVSVMVVVVEPASFDITEAESVSVAVVLYFAESVSVNVTVALPVELPLL